MNNWKKILDQLPDDPGDEKQFRTTEINLQAKSRKKILGLSPAFFGVCISVFSLLLLTGIVCLVLVCSRVNRYDRIYPGVTALGVQLGGMTEDEAVNALNEYSENYFSSRSLTVRCLDQSVTIQARDIMTGIDAQSIAHQAYAYGRERSVFRRYALIKSEAQHKLSVSGLNGYDRDAVNQALDSLVASVEKTYRAYSYLLDSNGLTITRGNDGVEINRTALGDTVHSMLETGSYGEYVVEPKVTKAEIPDWNILRETFCVAAQDAYVEKSGSRGYQIVEEVIGKDIDIYQLNEDMQSEEAWTEKTYPFIYTTPQMTKQMLGELLFRDVLGQAVSPYNSAEANRTTNLKLATEKVNEIILLPGEEFSFNRIVGERTEARGFKPAIVFAGGEMVDGTGGGICQVSSTIYLATLRADLEVTERAVHAYTVDYVPLGQDATVQWGYLDYRFVNNTAYPVRVSAVMQDGTLTVCLYGTKTDPNRHVEVETVTTHTYPYSTEYVYNETLAYGTQRQTQRGKDGYQCETYQLIYNGDTLLERRLANKSYYKSQTQIVEVNPAP